MKRGIGVPGFTSEWKLPTRSPPRYLTAPTSVMAAEEGDPPVVSRSTAQNVTRYRGVSASSSTSTPAASIRHRLPRGRAEVPSVLEQAFDGQAEHGRKRGKSGWTGLVSRRPGAGGGDAAARSGRP